MIRALIVVACFAWACGEEASPLLDQRGTGAPVEPWLLPTPGVASTTTDGTAGRLAEPARSPDGAWFLVKGVQASDVVEDPARERLYLSALTGQVARYDLHEQQLIGKWDLGGELLGMDLSPDGNTLLVADRIGSAPRLHRIDLQSEQTQVIQLPLAESGGGATLDVAFIDDAHALVALKNSKGPDLAVLNLGDSSIRPVHWGGSEPMLVSNHDRSRIAFAINGASFAVGHYLVAEERFEETAQQGRISALAVHPRADRIAFSYGQSVTLLDAQLHTVSTIPAGFSAAVGLALIQNGEQLAVAWPNLSALAPEDKRSPLEVFDLQTSERIAALDTTHAFSGAAGQTAGQLKTSQDGRKLFARTTGGLVVHTLVPSATE